MNKASWEACGQYVRNARTTDNPTGDLVAEVWLGQPNAAELARLMAAAPDLLKWLTEAVKTFGPEQHEIRDRARAAISKATGLPS